MVTFNFVASLDPNGLPVVTLTKANDGQGGKEILIPSDYHLRMLTEGYGLDALFRLEAVGNEGDTIVFNRSQITPVPADNDAAFSLLAGLGFGANQNVNAAGGGGGGGDATAANQVLGNASLTSIDGKLTDVSTATNQTATNTKLDTVITNQGTDGAAPPVIPGTGVRGWLRSIYDRLGTGISATISDKRSFYQELIELNLANYKPRDPNFVSTANNFVTTAATVSLRHGSVATLFATSAINNVTGVNLIFQSTGGGAANDTALGSGAQRLIVTGTRIIAGVQTPEQSETIIMNGVTPVLSAFSDWLRIDSVRVSQVGAARANLGQIIIVFSGTPVNYQIPVNAMRMYNGGFHVPNNREAYISAIQITPSEGNQDRQFIISISQRPFNAFGTPTTPSTKLYEVGCWQHGSNRIDFRTPIRVLANQDVEIQAISLNGNIGVSATLEHYIKI